MHIYILGLYWSIFCLVYSLKHLIYLILALYAAPQFSLCVKQAVLSPVSLKLPSR